MDAAGKAAMLSWTKHGYSYVIEAGGTGAKFIRGTFDFGWFGIQGGRIKCVKLTYYTGTVLGTVPTEGKPLFGSLVPFEVVPPMLDGKLRFQTFWLGTPLAGAEFDVAVVQAPEKPVAADERGITKMSFEKPGRHEVWARYMDKMPRKTDGRKYDEARFYAMLDGAVGVGVHRARRRGIAPLAGPEDFLDGKKAGPDPGATHYEPR